MRRSRSVALTLALLLSPGTALGQAARGLSPWVDLPATRAAARPIGGGTAPRACRRGGELDISGGVNEISVAPGGRVWLAQREGAVHASAGVDRPFAASTLDCASASRQTPRGGCDRVTFFDANVAIATGYVADAHDGYYLTTNAGRTWELRRFTHGYGEWIYEVFTTSAGEAWMGGSSGAMFHSTDFGRTWSAITAPFDGSKRLYSIFMATPSRGIVGALSNGLRVTDDGGRTWRAIATPMDQGVVRPPTSTDERLDRVAWIGDTLVVEQSGRVFTSPSRTVRWTPLGGFVAFAVSRDGRHLFAIDAHRAVSEIDTALRPTPIPGARLPRPAIDLSVVDGALYALDESYGLHRFARAASVSSAATTGGAPPTIERVRRAGDLLLGISPHMVFASTDGGATWCSAASTDARLVGLEARSDTEALVWGERDVFRFDVRSGRLRAIDPFGGATVSEVTTTPTAWLATTTTRTNAAQLWRSTDRGARWTRIDEWTGAAAFDVVAVDASDVLVWPWDLSIRRVSPAAVPPFRFTSALAASEMPCCRVGYFTSATDGFLRGYVHHMGDHVFATSDGGRTWTPRTASDFPYAEVVPFRDGALAVVGGSFDYRASSRRDLHFLRGVERRRIHRARESISDVSIDPSGRVLLELDPTPGPTFETAGRRWIEIVP